MEHRFWSVGPPVFGNRVVCVCVNREREVSINYRKKTIYIRDSFLPVSLSQ